MHPLLHNMHNDVSIKLIFKKIFMLSPELNAYTCNFCKSNMCFSFFFFWVILHVTINNEINILAFVYKFIVLHVVIKRVIKLEQDAIKKNQRYIALNYAKDKCRMIYFSVIMIHVSIINRMIRKKWWTWQQWPLIFVDVLYKINYIWAWWF